MTDTVPCQRIHLTSIPRNLQELSSLPCSLMVADCKSLARRNGVHTLMPRGGAASRRLHLLQHCPHTPVMPAPRQYGGLTTVPLPWTLHKNVRTTGTTP
jgi:hypothetical protein